MKTLTTNAREITLIQQHSPMAYYLAFYRLLDEYRRWNRQQAYRYY